MMGELDYDANSAPANGESCCVYKSYIHKGSLRAVLHVGIFPHMWWMCGHF
jgi:hypothetical protein